jgi:hypothetical protein
MEFDVSVMAFKEEHMKHLNETLGMFGYRVLGERAKVHGDSELSKQMQNWDLGNNRVLKAVVPSAGWTVIYDPERAMFSNTRSCQEYSRKHSAGVIGMICERSSKTYGFTIYEKGEKVREYLNVDGAIKTNLGKRLLSELGLNLSDKSIGDDDIFEIFLGVTGVDLYSLLETGEFTIKELERSGGGTGSQASASERKSVLKFWK